MCVILVFIFHNTYPCPCIQPKKKYLLSTMRRHEFESFPFLLFMLLRSFLVTFLSIHISFIFLQLFLKFILWFRDTGLSKREGSRSLNAGIGWIVDKSASFLIVEPKFRIPFLERFDLIPTA